MMDRPQEFLQKFSRVERSGRRADIEVPHAELDGSGERTRISVVACYEAECVAVVTAGKPAGGHPSPSDGVEKTHILTPVGWSNVLNPGHWGGDADVPLDESLAASAEHEPETVARRTV